MTESSDMYSQTGVDPRPYYAADFARFFFALLTSGIVKGRLNEFIVTAGAGLSVNVDSGYSWIIGYFAANDAIVNVAIAPNSSGNPRIDRIILRARELPGFGLLGFLTLWMAPRTTSSFILIALGLAGGKDEFLLFTIWELEPDDPAWLEALTSASADDAATVDESMQAVVRLLQDYLSVGRLEDAAASLQGLGAERLIMTMLDLSNVREAVLFPRDMHRLVP